jgi:uncharacterized protein YdcH (DUF465 family)
MNKKARLTYEQQTSMIIVQRETIGLMRQQLSLQDAVFNRLFDAVQEQREQMQASGQDAVFNKLFDLVQELREQMQASEQAAMALVQQNEG